MNPRTQTALSQDSRLPGAVDRRFGNVFLARFGPLTLISHGSSATACQLLDRLRRSLSIVNAHVDPAAPTIYHLMATVGTGNAARREAEVVPNWSWWARVR